MRSKIIMQEIISTGFTEVRSHQGLASRLWYATKGSERLWSELESLDHFSYNPSNKENDTIVKERK